MEQITQAEWDAIPACNKDVWTTERTDWPNWEQVRDQYMGKRTLLRGNCLEVEGISFEIVQAVIKQEFHDGAGGRFELWVIYRGGQFVIGSQTKDQAERRLASLTANNWRFLDCYERGHPNPLDWIGHVRKQGEDDPKRAWSFDNQCLIEVCEDGRTFFGGNIKEYSAAFRYLILDKSVVDAIRKAAPEVPVRQTT